MLVLAVEAAPSLKMLMQSHAAGAGGGGCVCVCTARVRDGARRGAMRTCERVPVRHVVPLHLGHGPLGDDLEEVAERVEHLEHSHEARRQVLPVARDHRLEKGQSVKGVWVEYPGLTALLTALK